MASADDQTDADFFDKLVDDDDQAPLPANDQLPEAAALPRAVSNISLANDGPGAPDPSAPEPVPVPEGGSPAAGKGTSVHTAIKQVQWASFGGDDDGPNPFADLAGDDGFLGNMATLDTSAAATSGASDHAVLAAEVTDQDFFGGSPNHNAADGQLEHSGSGAVDSTDPKYFETMYPGWKYDQATQQWYQVEASGNAQQQPNDASYLQNSALETIAEEGTTTATTSSWASEYPPNMLFYAEYPGWYFDTNTQQWHSLELYQQAAVQPGTASALQNGTNYSVTAPSAAIDYNANQTDNNQVAQHNSFTNTYTHQNQGQGQVDAFANTMQSETVADASLTSSFYGFDQQANAESISSSTSHQVGFNSLQDHQKGLESSSLQSGYNSTDTQQPIYNAFEPSTSFQASYKGFEPAMGHQTSHHVSEQSTSNQGGYKAFQPSLGNQSDYKAFEPSSGRHAGYKGFMPSTGSQAGYKGSETSTVHQAAYKGYETSSVQQAGYMASQPSSDQISSYMGFETSANHGYADVNGVVNAQGFVSKESMYHGQKQANAYQQGHLSNSYLGTENSMNFTQQQFFGAHASHMQFGPSPHEGRSLAGRPPHAIVSFGFGGKLIVMKESSSMATIFNSGNQGNSGGTVSVLNLSEIVDKADQASSTNSGVLSYFHALCHQPVPGPLVGGSAASKDVNKWLDEMIAWYESSASDFQRENNINSDYATLGASHQSMEALTHYLIQVAAAHSCYLVAELNIDSYSESARLCLIGADHLKCPRTYVSPEAIQRTEVYEYAKVLGNSQYILLPFQPYKLIYAYMLAEVGRISDSLRYCQASMKVLKASGRAPELETWKQLFSSLEERIRTHQQGGYGTNLAPAKLVGKIFTSLDKSISRMMGTPSAPLPPLPQGSVTERESYSAPAAAKFGNSQSVMAMSSLMPSASMQSMSEITENSNGGTGRKIAHNRSVSEPDFGRTPKQGAGSDGTQSSASGSGSSRFGWLGSTLQKTMELVSKSHRQAKLGDQNKFYYDEKLKRWVEEGAAISAEEPPLPPPPSKSSFQNGLADHKFLNGPMSGSHAPNGVTEWKSSNSSEHGLGMPPVPPSQNQFSARGRMGVRSRYVDTFNKAGVSGAVPSYNKPAAPSVAPPAGAKFFMPTAAAASADQMSHQAAEIQSETMHHDERSASPAAETSFCSPLPSAQFSAPMSSTIHRHPSMDNISTPYQGSGVSAGSNSSSFSKSRAASWSGTYSEQFSAIAGARSPDGADHATACDAWQTVP
ncbi:hypothetical protein PR202_gb05956 [Eleusine coracana subsp. coracana]|uniref:Protein transport protein sec16 n=1 Tax=Eleusine coracana subsp. coracana TaxID=191504 RepID=A0AAV5E939_ELECO|nr:hypothetical protein PR202_gb05956 [Eleusine coracana subsp. coracana]